MSYAAKGEKVFECPDPEHGDCSPPKIKRSDHRLKRFYSTFDNRAWDICEIPRYRHLYDLISGSQTCMGIDECHRYVPLEDLIRILMAEKDEYIRKLEECCRNQKGDGIGETGKGKEFLQNQVASLTEEVNQSRELLRQAMHKLQNIDEIVNENKKLHCRLRCSEERIKFLEERKKHLERELAELRSRSQIQIDLERTQQMLTQVTRQREESPEMDEAALRELTLERDQLQDTVRKLEKELEESKKKENEIEMLKKQSQSDNLNIEEMSKENECYKKKLATMKCLEKQIQELKKQGRALADKYKREAQKASEQMKKVSQTANELQCLREERDSLRKRVDELASYECQYNALHRKLQRVDAVIAENEMLHSKVCALDKLEKENEYLRCRLNEIQEMEMNAAEDKERILHLQCAVADQEEEMKDLLCQIERLTSGRGEEELERLRCELYEKNSKLKLCEEQLAEIPMLEAEIDELRAKLQSCCREFPEKKTGESVYQKMEVRFPATSTGIAARYKYQSQKSSSVLGIRREEKVELEGRSMSCQEVLQDERQSSNCVEKKEMMSCEEVQCLLQSSKGIISCVLEDMIEHQKEMEELEKCNRAMKEEIEFLKSKIGNSDADALSDEVNLLKRALQEKERELCGLKKSPGGAAESEGDVETLKDLNRQMKAELEAACGGLKEVANLERQLELERKARCEAERMLGKGATVASAPAATPSTEVGNVPEDDLEYDCCKALQREIKDLKLQIVELNKLTDELKRENELLRELQQPCPDFSKELDEKCALENLLSLLQAELDAFKGQKLSDECEALRNELKRVMEQNCQLKALVDCYRQRLDLEKKSDKLTRMRDETAQAGASEGRPDGGGSEKPKKKKTDGAKPEVAAETEEEESEDGQISGSAKKSKQGRDLQSGTSTAKTATSEDQRESEKEKSAGRPTDSDQEKSLSRGGEPPASPPTLESGATEQMKEEKQLLAELDRLKKLLAEKDAALRSRDEELSKCKDNVSQLQEDNSAKDGKPFLNADLPDELAELQKRLKQMEEENAEKLKKLMDQHEKELVNRDKMHNDNLAAMKSGYETDIRKLAERHKQGIVRLQGLHEDELQELNSNYETQMETMQTQSEEAINDVAKGSAAKMRNLAERHLQEMQAMKDKEAKYLEELGGLRTSLIKSQQELDVLRKKGKDDADGSVARLKAKHSRELRKSRQSSTRRLSAMKEKFEEEQKKSQAQIETLKEKLKEKEKGEGVCDCNFAKNKRKQKPRDPTCPLDFNEVLEKILEQGLDSLSFNEIALVHRKTCCALEGIVMNSNVCPTLEPPVGDSCPHTPLLEADKQQLLGRIFALENEINRKQRQTQEAIINMEVAIRKERCRLQEVKNSLLSEQQKNSELKSLLTSQTKLQTDLKKERDKLGNQASFHQSLCMEKSKQLDHEMKSKKCLEAEIEKLKIQVKQLCVALDVERGHSECRQKEELDQIQLMRFKLEQSSHQEQKLALQLENETRYRMQLQCQVQALKQSFGQMVNLPAVEPQVRLSPNPLEAKSVKEKQNLDQIKEKKNRIKSKCSKKNKK